jgi:hypothetical protein
MKGVGANNSWSAVVRSAGFMVFSLVVELPNPFEAKAGFYPSAIALVLLDVERCCKQHPSRSWIELHTANANHFCEDWFALRVEVLGYEHVQLLE